jgi:hypothetical protein
MGVGRRCWAGWLGNLGGALLKGRGSRVKEVEELEVSKVLVLIGVRSW